jgi:hypothetical protein
MRHLTLLTALISLSVATAPAQSVDQLRQSFDQRCEQAATSRDDQLGKLNQSYQAALERLLEKTKSAGNLDAALPIHQELDALKQATATLPVLPDNAGELKPMRTKYLDTRQQILKTHATALVGLADKMETALKAREAELTKAGKIADAIAARESREELARNQDLLDAKQLLAPHAAPGANWSALLQADWEVLSAGLFYVGDAQGKKGKGSAYTDKLKQAVNDIPDKGMPHFVAVPPATVEFKFRRPMTELRTTVWMAAAGDAEVRVVINGKKMGSVKVAAGKTEKRLLEVKFAPTDRLSLEFDAGDSIESDWLVLLSPETR